MSVLGNGTKFNANDFIFTLANAPSVTKSLPSYSIPNGIPDGNSVTVYQLPVDGSNPNAENLTPGYYYYTLYIYLSDITWTGTCDGNLLFAVSYTEDSVLKARRRFRVFVNNSDNIDPGVSFTIGIPMEDPQNVGNIAVDVFNLTGADITGAYDVTINQYNLTRVSKNVSVVSL
jgi:hypothetical protein